MAQTVLDEVVAYQRAMEYCEYQHRLNRVKEGPLRIIRFVCVARRGVPTLVMRDKSQIQDESRRQ